jgi:hypothetical protein
MAHSFPMMPSDAQTSSTSIAQAAHIRVLDEAFFTDL